MRSATLCLTLGLLVVGGCNDGTAPSIAETTFASSLNVDLATMTQTPTGLYYKDLVVGSGALVSAGQQISIRYVGNLPNGTQFDANAAPQAPFTFRLGSGTVIAGFDQGVSGMRIGGRRQLIIPPSLGYGNERVGPIPANSILVFSIEVVGAQ
jgi:FKBP-type peptidyl-prolyl cis-trans isomerase